MKLKLIVLSLAVMVIAFGTGAGKRPEPTAVVRPEVLKLPVKGRILNDEVEVRSNLSEIALTLAKAQGRINFFTAEFKLTVMDKEKKNSQLNARGQLWLANKRRYRVHYQKPKQQLLVSNGQKRWLYLEEINQVQVQAMPPEGNPTEFFLELGGGLSRLLKICTATVEKKKNIMVYTLIPKEKSVANFDQAIIWTKGENKIPFKLEVSGKKIIQIDFKQIKTKLDNQKMNKEETALFEFISPKNAEVIEMLWPMQ